MEKLFIEIIGWIGVFFLVLAYFLLTHHDLTSRSKVYQWMNLVGAILLGINAYLNGAFPSFATNVVWLLVAVYGLTKIFRKEA